MSQNYHHLGSTIRAKTPAETLARIQPIMKQIGITRVADVTGLDHIGIPVAVCYRPNAKHLSASQGKAQLIELAKISAIMESIEGYHLENPKAAELEGSYHQLRQHYNLINPAELVDGFFEPEDIANQKLSWASCINLIDKKEYFIPAVLVNIDSTELNPAMAWFNVTTNGLASGNTLQEAICHGLYEVIERDNITKWQALSETELDKTRIDIHTINRPSLQHLLQKFAQQNIEVTVWEASSNQVPTFYCLIKSLQYGTALGQFFGCGAHIDKDVALSRAITEAAQSRLTLISGGRDDLFANVYQQQSLSQNLLLAEQLNQLPVKQAPGKNYQQCLTNSYKPSFADNIDWVVTILQKNGFDKVLCYNHTKAELNIPVVQIFIPGMQTHGVRF